jgi:hypothetical protein
MQRLLIVLLLLVGAPARAQLDDVSRAREALERGDVLPLADILALVQGELDARVIEVEFEERRASMSTSSSRSPRTAGCSEATADAVTGRILTMGPDDDEG